MNPYLIIIIALSFLETNQHSKQIYINRIDPSIEIMVDTIKPITEKTKTIKEVFKVVENMPMFPGSIEGDLEERRLRAYEMQLSYIYSNLIYPEEAMSNELEGRVLVEFIVNKDGSISDAVCIEDIGSSCGAEAIKVVESMPNWEPGTQRGKAVDVKIKMPIYFRLGSLETWELEEGETDFFKVVEKMPRFPGCTVGNEAAKRNCAQEKMLEHLYSNLSYPKKARKKGIKGTVVIRFTVDTDGSLQDIECIRDIGAGCGAEALRVVKTMPDWEPGFQRGKPVKVQFNMPIKFNL